MTPTVSVVIPCYNLGEYLDEAVQSVLDQTFQDFEILIVDDGSTDERTRSLLASYARPKTRIIRTENRGLPAAKNSGAANTTGRYLCMLDADDRLDPRYMEVSVAALEANPTLAFVSHWLRTFGDEDNDWTPERCDFPALLDMNTVNGAALVRREAVQAAGGFDEAMRDGCEDWDFWITLVERGFAGHILPEILFQYRRRRGSMSRTMLKDDGHARLYAYLARKHSAAFRQHLPALLSRREQDETTLLAQCNRLALEHFEWAELELARRRDDVAIAERQAARRRAELERQRLKIEVEVLRDARAIATSEALKYHADANRSAEELASLRQSASWRLTRPLRRIVDLFRGRRGGDQS